MQVPQSLYSSTQEMRVIIITLGMSQLLQLSIHCFDGEKMDKAMAGKEQMGSGIWNTKL